MERPKEVTVNFNGTRRTNSPLCWYCGEVGTLITSTVYGCDKHPEGMVTWTRYTMPVNPYIENPMRTVY